MKPHSDIDFIQAYLDGQLPPEQVVAMENRLRNDPKLADLLLRVSREEAVLTEWAGSQAAVAGKDSPSKQDENTLPFRRPGRWAAAILVASVAAAAVAIAWLGGFTFHPSQPHAIDNAVVGKVGDVQGDEVYVVSEAGETAAKPGQTLRPGQSVRVGKDSFAVVFADASRLEIGTDSTVRLLASGPPTVSDQQSLITKVFLEQGTLAADASGRPMLVTTANAEARLIESRANFTTVARGTRIESERGQVQLTRKSDGVSINMPTDSFAVATANSTEHFTPQPMPQPITQARLILREVNKDNLGPIHTIAYSPDGTTLAAGSVEGTVKLWNMAASGLAMPGFKTGGRSPVRGLAYSPDGSVLAATSEDRNVKFYTATTHQELAVLKGHKTAITCLAFAPSGVILATGSGGPQRGELKLWNVESRLELANLTGHHTAILSLAFSADSGFIAAGCRDGTVRIWELATREVKHTLIGHTAPVNAVAFSPNGQTLATAGKDLTIKFWDTVTGSEQRTFAGLVSEVRSIAFSPDGKLFAAADNTVRLWDLASGQQLRILKGHKNAITAVIFSPSGKEIASAGADRTIRIWDVPTP